MMARGCKARGMPHVEVHSSDRHCDWDWAGFCHVRPPPFPRLDQPGVPEDGFERRQCHRIRGRVIRESRRKRLPLPWEGPQLQT